MSKHINFDQYLNRQKNEDRRSFIIYGPALSGKTRFARRIQDSRQDVYYLDLQEYFLTTSGPKDIHEFNSETLWDLLLALDVQEPVILVDNLDFLVNTWNVDGKKAFLNRVKYQLRSPVHTRKTFVFFFQTDTTLTSTQFNNSYDEPRVITLGEFEAL